MNSYLPPLQKELLNAWNEGISVTLSNPARQVIVRLALACIACDIPATRKVCGFLGHRSTLGCNKCYKSFQQIKEGDTMWTNYAGFDTSLWTTRNNKDH